MAAAASTSLKCDRRPRQDPRRRGHCVGERKKHASASANTITRQQCHQENALHCGQIEQQAAQSVLLQHVRGGRPAGQWDLVGAYAVAGHTSVVVWTGPRLPSGSCNIGKQVVHLVLLVSSRRPLSGELCMRNAFAPGLCRVTLHRGMAIPCDVYHRLEDLLPACTSMGHRLRQSCGKRTALLDGTRLATLGDVVMHLRKRTSDQKFKTHQQKQQQVDTVRSLGYYSHAPRYIKNCTNFKI